MIAPSQPGPRCWSFERPASKGTGKATNEAVLVASHFPSLRTTSDRHGEATGLCRHCPSPVAAVGPTGPLVRDFPRHEDRLRGPSRLGVLIGASPWCVARGCQSPNSNKPAQTLIRLIIGTVYLILLFRTTAPLMRRLVGPFDLSSDS